MGIEREVGTLAPGLRADFVVWDARHQVTHAFIAGRLVYANN